MTTLGVTGHQSLPRSTRDFVAEAIRELLSETEPPLSAVTALAAGADQLLAAELLRAGGRLSVIVPSLDYERTFTVREDLDSFQALLGAADAVTRLDYPEPSEAAFLAAGMAVVDECDRLIAIWDGEPARGLGGTADIVRYARESGTPVSILWPEGAGR